MAGGGGGGGGQSGGLRSGGGGGAGGVLTSFVNVTPQSYVIVVGQGGPGGTADNAGSAGQSSLALGFTAIGGGGGGSINTGPNTGGSGGGGSGQIETPATGTTGQGTTGGNGISTTPFAGGGGGGSNTPGQGPLGNGAGGNGISSSITGTATFYAGGGGGGNSVTGGGRGGQGGGGNGGGLGGNLGSAGSAATANTGGGGGGAGGQASTAFAGGAGGSGIVIIKYPGAQQATGGTVTTAGGFTTHAFTASGTFAPLTWLDVSGQLNNGTLFNSPTFSSTNSGSIVFNGTTQYVAGSIATINSWSMCLWYLSTDITSQAVFYPFSGTTTASGLGFGGTFDASTVNRWYFFDGTNASFSSANTAVTTNVWYNLVVTKSSTTYNLYTNGTLSLTGTGVDLALTQYNLGRRGDAVWYARGNIAQASIYNRALTAEEVNQNFQALRGRFGV